MPVKQWIVAVVSPIRTGHGDRALVPVVGQKTCPHVPLYVYFFFTVGRQLVRQANKER
ncbi:hypothetical protein [Aquibacillus sediminis]|uniref:hypothetical protein n=1 Tax=Aquibacillus sediminis TaxID=2574734 RepID=UPI00148661E4|nr:hypothetical protein [Aquibacillus sediminis]